MIAGENSLSPCHALYIYNADTREIKIRSLMRQPPWAEKRIVVLEVLKQWLGFKVNGAK
jgi:hypothetical protein